MIDCPSCQLPLTVGSLIRRARIDGIRPVVSERYICRNCQAEIKLIVTLLTPSPLSPEDLQRCLNRNR